MSVRYVQRRIGEPGAGVTGVSVSRLRERFTVATVDVMNAAAVFVGEGRFRSVGVAYGEIAADLERYPRLSDTNIQGCALDSNTVKEAADLYLDAVGNSCALSVFQ